MPFDCICHPIEITETHWGFDTWTQKGTHRDAGSLTGRCGRGFGCGQQTPAGRRRAGGRRRGRPAGPPGRVFGGRPGCLQSRRGFAPEGGTCGRQTRVGYTLWKTGGPSCVRRGQPAPSTWPDAQCLALKSIVLALTARKEPPGATA